MLTCSLIEACKIWSEFSECLDGRNGFGSTVCEIYSYRLQPYHPSFHGEHPAGWKITGLYRDAERETYESASRSLVWLLEAFCHEHKCTATMNGVSIQEWKEATDYFDHRCHIKIIKENE